MMASGLFQTGMGQGGLEVMKRLTGAGYAAYAVGGCVRDALLDRPVKDIDIATSAKPEQVLEIFPHAIPTGLKHGTVTIPHRGWNYEVTTFRTESDYSDGRRPDAVFFINRVEEDLQRRDFTINAMAIDKDGSLVDPFGGLNDLKARILRAVGDAAERFQEDALRMLRCVRFAAEYDLTVDQPTWKEVCSGAPKLKGIAMERVFAELDRMISSSAPYRAISLLHQSGLLRWTKAKLRFPLSLGLLEKVEEEDPLRRIGQVDDSLARWGVWFIRMGIEPGQVKNVCKALKTSGRFEDGISRLLELHVSLRTVPDETDVRRRAWIAGVLKCGEESAQRWLKIAAGIGEGPENGWMKPFADFGPGWLKEMGAKDRSDLRISGDDVLALARRKKGPWIKHLLDRLLKEAALGQLPNEREALLARAKELVVHESK